MAATNVSKVLIVEDDQGLGRLLQDEAADGGLEAQWVDSAAEAMSAIDHWRPDLVVSDLRLPDSDGLTLLRQVRTAALEDTPDFLIITAFGTISTAVEALKAGAEDFLTKPLDLEHFMLSVNRILEKRHLREEVVRIRSLMDGSSFHGMYGHSRCMIRLYDQIRQIAKADGPVLIAGESGTGKELVARAIHLEGKGKSRPFLAVNCAGIPEQLLESEFFGHEAGSFTGATRGRRGLFAEAEGGTLLLDEISEMPLTLQAKLLRMLQDGKVRPVGANREQQVDVRIVAATNQDLEDEVRRGHFREDLFYRLETFALHVPPLREREEDVELLAGHFLQTFALRGRKQITGFSPAAGDLLRRYSFPGNVRELHNAVERAVTFCHQEKILPEHLPLRIRRTAEDSDKVIDSYLGGPATDENTMPSLAEIEAGYIRRVLERVRGNKSRAASILGIGRRTLYRRLGMVENERTTES